MTIRRLIATLVALDELNFLLTNRVPRRLLTRLVGRLSRIEHPLVARGGIALWSLFAELDLRDAAADRFGSIGACFTRGLVPGARPFAPAPDVLASPCDAVVGALGRIEQGRAWQIKGAPYRLDELLGDDRPGNAALAAGLDGAAFCTLRLTSGMYHRFHAPADLVVEGVRYLSGDCWNVNTPALRRVERLFCRNERAVIRCRLPDGSRLILVAVAAILVAGIRLRVLDPEAALRPGGPRDIPVSARFGRGDEMGWFEHGSTIVVIAEHAHPTVATGDRTRAGLPLMRHPPATAP